VNKINVTLSSFYLYLLLLFSVSTALSRTSLLNIWLIIEINTILFLSILCSSLAGRKRIIKYFIIQASASIAIVLRLLLVSSNTNFSLLLTQGSLVIKLGTIPGHIWYISIIQDLRWLNIYILSTIQKIIPLRILSRLSPHFAIMFFILISRLGGLLGTKSRSIKRLMAYSGVLNVGWLLGSSMSINSFVFFFLCYFFTMGGVVHILSSNESALILDSKSGFSSTDTILMGALLLSLAGLPPFINFWAKVLVLKVMIFSSTASAIAGLILTIITRWMVYLYLGLIDKFILKNNSFRLKALKFYSTSKYVIVYLIPVLGGWLMV